PVIQIEDLPPEFHAPTSPETAAPVIPAAGLKAARADIPPIPFPCPSASLAGVKQAAEALHIADALARNKNNRQRAAAELGISRMTLYTKIRLYGLMGAMSA